MELDFNFFSRGTSRSHAMHGMHARNHRQEVEAHIMKTVIAILTAMAVSAALSACQPPADPDPASECRFKDCRHVSPNHHGEGAVSGHNSGRDHI